MTVTRWICQAWVTKSRRCGARMTLTDAGYRCPRCSPLTDPEEDAHDH